MYSTSSIIPPGNRMEIQIDLLTQDLLRRMWVPGLLSSSRFKTKFDDFDKELLTEALTWQAGTTKYKISDISLEIDDAFIHYIEFDLTEKLPRQITNHYLGHSVVLSKLSDSSRQSINLFFPPSSSTSDFFMCFLRDSDLNTNTNPDMFTSCRSLPPGLREMQLTKSNKINSSAETFANFHLKDLHLNRMNISWQNYLNYLVDFEFLDMESAYNFFVNNKSRIISDDAAVSTQKVGHSPSCYFPICLTGNSTEDKPMISVQSGQVNFSSLALNLIFETVPTDLSLYYLCVVYFQKYSLNFNLGQNIVSLSPVPNL